MTHMHIDRLIDRLIRLIVGCLQATILSTVEIDSKCVHAGACSRRELLLEKEWSGVECSIHISAVYISVLYTYLA
jgi:hypothetical protein